jgi:hypothetical protein
LVARGDADAINKLLPDKLEKVHSDESGWTSIYRHRDTNELWELSYPRSEMQGGGPRRLRLLRVRNPLS